MKEGQDVIFKASLMSSDQQIICHVFCEEIGMSDSSVNKQKLPRYIDKKKLELARIFKLNSI